MTNDKPEKPDLTQAASGSPIVATVLALLGMIPHGRWLVFAALVVFGTYEAFELYHKARQTAAETARIEAQSEITGTPSPEIKWTEDDVREKSIRLIREALECIRRADRGKENSATAEDQKKCVAPYREFQAAHPEHYWVKP